MRFWRSSKRREIRRAVRELDIVSPYPEILANPVWFECHLCDVEWMDKQVVSHCWNCGKLGNLAGFGDAYLKARELIARIVAES